MTYGTRPSGNQVCVALPPSYLRQNVRGARPPAGRASFWTMAHARFHRDVGLRVTWATYSHRFGDRYTSRRRDRSTAREGDPALLKLPAGAPPEGKKTRPHPGVGPVPGTRYAHVHQLEYAGASGQTSTPRRGNTSVGARVPR